MHLLRGSQMVHFVPRQEEVKALTGAAFDKRAFDALQEDGTVTGGQVGARWLQACRCQVVAGVPTLALGKPRAVPGLADGREPPNAPNVPCWRPALLPPRCCFSTGSPTRQASTRSTRASIAPRSVRPGKTTWQAGQGSPPIPLLYGLWRSRATSRPACSGLAGMTPWRQ